jgi:hypothetical protein
MSGPGFTNDGAVLAAVNTAFRAACGGGLRPVLTAPARGALQSSGRDGETPFSRTKKHSAVFCSAKGEALNGIRAG